MAIKAADLTQEEAAKRLGTTRQTLGIWFKYEELSEEILQNVMSNIRIDFTNSSDSASPSPKINHNRKGVPYFDVNFIGSFDLVYDSKTAHPAFYIDFMPFNDADYWVNVSGKSMGPLIAHGDIVALKEVHDWKRFLLEGEIYAIVTDNGFRTIKILGAGPDSDHYSLIPYNKSDDYKPQPIPKEVITHVFRVKGAIKKFF